MALKTEMKECIKVENSFVQRCGSIHLATEVGLHRTPIVRTTRAHFRQWDVLARHQLEEQRPKPP